MTTNEDALDARAAVGKLKTELPVSYVLAYAQLRPEQSGSRVRATCPFHNDSSPSLEVWIEDDGTQRWGCWPCGKRGDVIDLIRELWGLGFGAAVEAGRLLLSTAGDWKGPAPAVGSTWDSVGAARLMMDAYKAFDSGAVAQLIELKGWHFSPWHLRDRMCGTQHGRLIVPYFNRHNQLVAVKHRSLLGNDKLISLPGALLRDVLYGENVPHLGPSALITEGESDAWTAGAAIGVRIAVRGLPSGAGTPPHPYVNRLSGLRVYLAFDGDEAGDSGASRWATALVYSDVIRLDIPRGYDLTSVGTVDWLHALT